MLVLDYDYESRIMTYSLETGGKVSVHIEDELFTYYGPGLDLEIYFYDDAAKDIWFKIGGEYYTALQIIQRAEADHDAVRHEYEMESASEGEDPYIQSDFI